MIDRPKSFLLATYAGLITIFPVFKVSAYAFDFSKDCALFVYFATDRWDFIHSETIHGLIYYYGVSILASSLAMTYIVQVTKDSVLLLQNSELLQTLKLELDSDLVTASCSDPHLAVLSSNGEVIVLQLEGAAVVTPTGPTEDSLGEVTLSAHQPGVHTARQGRHDLFS